MNDKELIYFPSSNYNEDIERVNTIANILSRSMNKIDWHRISFTKFHFSENNYQILKSLIDKSYHEIQENLLDEPMGVEKVEGNLENNLYSKFNKYMHTEEDIFKFLSEIFIGYLGGHYLTNGNKRFSICFLKNTLNFFGFNFKDYSKFFQVDSKYNGHTILSYFVTKISAKDGRINIEIDNWIKENIIIR